MDRVIGGYTILEVLLVLSMTALLFLSAMIIIGGQSGETNFNQAMQDINSKIQNYASQISASSYPGSENYSCSINNVGRAELSTTNPGTNSNCLFLGRAIQAIPGYSSLLAYTVLGNRDQYDDSGNDLGQQAQTITQARPKPAIFNSKFVMMDIYQLGAGAMVVSSNVVNSGTTSEADLVGLYNGLPGDQAANSSGAAALIMKAYPCTAVSNNCQINTPDPTVPLGQSVKACLTEVYVSSTLNCANPPIISKWTICFGDSGSNRKAQLTVNSAPGGITTQLAFVGCT